MLLGSFAGTAQSGGILRRRVSFSEEVKGLGA
jgi:hypothetical protein